MTVDIELPPLPDLPAYSSEVFDREVKVVSEAMAEQLMQDYARSAIKYGRQQRGEPVARVNAEGFIVEIGLDLAPGTNLYVDPQPAEPVKQNLPPLHLLSIPELRELAMRDCSKYDDDDLAIAWELFDRLVEGDRIVESEPRNDGFDKWLENPYTKALEKSIKEDYVPQPAAPTIKESLTVAEPVEIRLATHLFNSGYMAGHHDTVEGCFTDIHQSDMTTHQSDVVSELMGELEAPQPADPAQEVDPIEIDNEAAANRACNVLVGLGYAWNGKDWVAMLAATPAQEPSDDAIGVLKLALEYWADRQQRYRNRAPVWVQEARALLARYGAAPSPKDDK